MHRSGTSCLTGSLQQKGLYLDKVFEWNKYNLKGNRENKQIMNLNDSVLATSGGSWDNPPEKIIWTDNEAKMRDDVIQTLSLKTEEKFGFKDPRALLTMAFWKAASVNIKLVASLRHPILVAKSLHNRSVAMKKKGNELTLEKGLQLWYVYNKHLLSYLEEEKFPVISFDVDQNDYLSGVNYISEYLELDKSPNGSDDPFIEQSLINQTLDQESTTLPEHIENLYFEIKKYCINCNGTT